MVGHHRVGVLQRLEATHESREVPIVLIAALGLDQGQQAPYLVNCLQEGRGAGRIQDEMAVPESAQEVLGGVGQLLQAAEAQEASGPLNGVDGPEDAPEQLTRRGVLLERHEIPVQLVEVLGALNEELLDYLVHFIFVHFAPWTATDSALFKPMNPAAPIGYPSMATFSD